MLKKDSHCTCTSDTPLCECGQADESVEHFLLYCEKYAESRKVMMDIVRDLVSATKSKQSLKITVMISAKETTCLLRKHCLNLFPAVIGTYNKLTLEFTL